MTAPSESLSDHSSWFQKEEQPNMIESIHMFRETSENLPSQIHKSVRRPRALNMGPTSDASFQSEHDFKQNS